MDWQKKVNQDRMENLRRKRERSWEVKQIKKRAKIDEKFRIKAIKEQRKTKQKLKYKEANAKRGKGFLSKF